MINTVYKNDTKENLKIFSDLKVPKEYSNKSKEYDSMFNLTYSKFYDNLKNYNNKLKSININSFYTISSQSKKSKNYNTFKEFDILKIKSAIEKMKEKEKKLKEKRENPYTERCLYSNPIYTLLKDKIKSKKKEKMKLMKKDYNIKSNTPEIGRYNPIYQAINKHTQQVIFSLKNFEEYNKNFTEKIKHKKYNSRNRSHNKIENKNKTSPSLNFENKQYKTNYLSYHKDKSKENKNINNSIFYNTAIVKKNNNRNEGRNLNKNNHCLRFETYTPRKPLINKIFYKTENNIETRNCFRPKNVKGIIQFNKISSNKNAKNYFEKIINQKKDMPSLGFYRPNYSLVTNKTMNVFINSKKNEKNNMKITKLKKILGSYNVRGEYQMFNLLNHIHQDLSKDNLE